MEVPLAQKYAIAARCGAKLRREREAQGLTITEVAKQAGFVQQQVSEVELGHINTPIETLARIAKVLHLPLEDVVVDPTQRLGTSKHDCPLVSVDEGTLATIIQKTDELSMMVRDMRGSRALS